MKQLLFAFFVLSITLLLAACGTTTNSSVQTIRGSGNVITLERVVGNFTAIQVNIGADLVLSQGSGEALTLEADDNLMEYIQTEVQNDRLIITSSNNTSITSSQTLRLYVTFDALREIEIFGSSNITAENINLDSLTITFSGSGSTRMTGSVSEQSINIRGQATINNAELTSRNVTIDVSGNSTINVNATDTLDITVAGRADIRYVGSPIITQNISGSANIAQQQ